EGWDVCVNARREPMLRTLVSSFPSGDHLVCAGDYSEPATISQMEKVVGERWGRLDALVNCAGVFIAVPAIGSPLEQWRKCFDIMVNGAVGLTRLAVPLMTQGGRIVHVTSIHGERAEAGGSSYAMAKAALNQYCRGLALELAAKGILVNAIAPGFVDTPMSIRPDGVNELDTEWFRAN